MRRHHRSCWKKISVVHGKRVTPQLNRRARSQMLVAGRRRRRRRSQGGLWPSKAVGLLRRLLPAILVLVLAGALFVVSQPPSASGADRASLASRFRFRELPVALPPGLPERTIRDVNPRYEQIRAWISSVGAGVAVN